MLNRLPRHLPPVSMILDDIGRPKAAAVANALGVNRRTVERWIANDKMPRSAHLALFWLSRWGQSIVDAEAVNTATMYAGLARCYGAQNDALRQRIEKLITLADFGSANSPLLDVSRASSAEHGPTVAAARLV